MTKIAYVSRDLNNLIAGIIGAAPFLDSGLRRNDGVAMVKFSR